MRSYETGFIRPEIYEAHRPNRLRGGKLSSSAQGVCSLLVRYEGDTAFRFNGVLERAKRLMPGVHLLKINVEQPDAKNCSGFTALASRGFILPRHLKNDIITGVTDGAPVDGLLHEQEDDEAVPTELTDADMEWLGSMDGQSQPTDPPEGSPGNMRQFFKTALASIAWMG